VHEGEILKGSNFDRESRKCYYIVIQKSLVIGLGQAQIVEKEKKHYQGLPEDPPERVS
jgi:hypothetical protein